MKKIHIAITDKKKVICVPRPSALPELLEVKENVIEDWFYSLPKGLESFLLQNPEEQNYFAKAFGYWVLCKSIPGMVENQNQYGMLKRKLSKFSKKLFRAIKNLAARIALQVQKFYFSHRFALN
ncbi:hypothetical protein KKG31_00550 [Patescibacteria group bacterium]|nr:hypothetical protein [Patescibacteria group bacterium]MBU1757676.1 hypothetical protein [Patescibacteria group bacterium]